MALDPSAIANCYTLEQIENKITEYQEYLDKAAATKEYDLDTTQGRQKVKTEDVDKIANLLNSYLKAKSIKTGSSETKLYAAKYTGGIQ